MAAANLVQLVMHPLVYRIEFNIEGAPLAWAALVA